MAAPERDAGNIVHSNDRCFCAPASKSFQMTPNSESTSSATTSCVVFILLV